jgi:TRAP transporter TAXI family solute receptor
MSTHNSKVMVFLLGFVFFVAALFPGIGYSQQKRTQFNIVTGPSTGAYYALGAGMSQMLKKHVAGYSLSVASTGGSGENVRLVGGNKADLGIVMPDSAYFGYTGKGPYTQPYPNLRAVMAGHPSMHHLVTLKAAIKTPADLKGKKVALGNPGSDAVNASKAILAAYGLTEGDYKAEYLSYPEQVEAMKDGNLDAGFIMSGLPAAGITELAATSKVFLIPLDPKKLEAIISTNPYWSKTTIPAKAYKGQDEPVLVLAAPSVMIVNSNVPEDFVYLLIKMIIEYTSELTAIHSSGKYWDLDGVIDSIAIPLHPGAVKYLTERKISIPAGLKP